MTASARYTRTGLAVSEKRTHFGRAGEFFAMSELLLRGWNVAVPVIDVGDDVFVIDDRRKTTYRVQVKSSRLQKNLHKDPSASFTISRLQLSDPQEIELFYMLMVRSDERWRFFIAPRKRLHDLHTLYLAGDHSGPGRPPKNNDDATTDGLKLTIALRDEPTAWGVSFGEFEYWPPELLELPTGPGSIRR